MTHGRSIVVCVLATLLAGCGVAPVRIDNGVYVPWRLVSNACLESLNRNEGPKELNGVTVGMTTDHVITWLQCDVVYFAGLNHRHVMVDLRDASSAKVRAIRSALIAQGVTEEETPLWVITH